MKKVVLFLALLAILLIAVIITQTKIYSNEGEKEKTIVEEKSISDTAFTLETFEKNGLTRSAAKINDVYYSPFTSDPCEPRKFDIVGISEAELELSQPPFFTLKDQNHAMLKQMYEDVNFLHSQLSFEEFTSNSPLFLWKNPENQWIAFKHIDYFFPRETECGLR